MNGNVLVTGAGGMLGRAMVQALTRRGTAHRALTRGDLDVRDDAAVTAAIAPGTTLVINCSAYTDVDGAETDFDAAFALNAEAPGRMARRCAEVGAGYVDFGTDYVFDGKGTAPYPVDGPHAPCNAYGRSKAAGEDAIATSNARFLLVRTSWVYAPWGKNFVRTIAALARSRGQLEVVNDQRGRPTSGPYLAERTLQLLDAGAEGIHHGTDGGECTWFELACAVVSGLGIEARVDPCGADRFQRPAVRPEYSVLDLSRTEALIGPSRDWRDNLADVLAMLEP